MVKRLMYQIDVALAYFIAVYRCAARPDRTPPFVAFMHTSQDHESNISLFRTVCLQYPIGQPGAVIITMP